MFLNWSHLTEHHLWLTLKYLHCHHHGHHDYCCSVGSTIIVSFLNELRPSDSACTISSFASCPSRRLCHCDLVVLNILLALCPAWGLL
jgi:hypothetical protein